MDIDIKTNDARRDLGRKEIVNLRALEKEKKERRKAAPFLRPRTEEKYADVRKKELLRTEKEKVVPVVSVSQEKAQAQSGRFFAAAKRTAPHSHNFLRAEERARCEEHLAAGFSFAPKKKQRAAAFRAGGVFAIFREKPILRFAACALMVPLCIFSLAFFQSQYEQKGRVLGASTAALDDLRSAASAAFASEFALTGSSFESANMNFAEARKTIDGIGLGIGEVIAELPINTPLSTAQDLATAGEELALSGQDLSAFLEKIAAPDDKQSFLGKLEDAQADMESAAEHLDSASAAIAQVDTRYLPEEMRPKVTLAQDVLPKVSANFHKLSEDFPLLLRLLGSERPQKYLLLFENNSEMRATGGFIGTYGILDIEGGEIKSLAIDGIFNPDGQLKEKIVPPMPIQKISTAWSMHDANWFADYPTSARKIALLYEKSGGPTVDGVIAVTPETVKKLLLLTGPIEMPAYGLTITADNFVAETQNQVESLYDPRENRPKKILSDLAPLLLARVFAMNKENGGENLLRFIEAGENSLKEKHILIYHRDEAIESMLRKRGWAGEVVQNEKGDYLSVVNSNINGYKTDAMIREKITLDTAIEDDGTVIDTVTITRRHQGGNEQYDWYNRVNADYMRVFVPKGSILLEASGYTAEGYVPPADYSAFKADAEVKAIENTVRIDPASGTQVFEEAGKTVFGNWVYVSPQEEVTVVYKYQLPFKIDFNAAKDDADAYSALIQKQAGSVGSGFEAAISFPPEWKVAWKTEKLREDRKLEEALARDMIYGLVLVKK